MAQPDSYCLDISQVFEQPIPTCSLGFKTFWTHHWSYKGGKVEDETDPTGDHLDPEHRPASIQQLLNLMVTVTTNVESKREVSGEKDGNLGFEFHLNSYKLMKAIIKTGFKRQQNKVTNRMLQQSCGHKPLHVLQTTGKMQSDD